MGDRRISIAELQQATTDLQSYIGPDQSVSPAEALVFLMVEPYVTRAAADSGMGISEDEARRELQRKVANPTQAGVEAMRAVGAYGLLLQTGRAQELGKAVQSAQSDGVQVNPRYGEFDASDLAALRIVATSPDWIAATGQPSLTPSGQ